MESKKNNFYLLLGISFLLFIPRYSIALTTQAQTFADHGALIVAVDGEIDVLNLVKSSTPNLMTGNINFIPSVFDAANSLLFEAQFQVDPDPLLNLRLQIFNPTDLPQAFTYQIIIPTDVTSGPTFNNTFANIELFDDDSSGGVFINSVNAFFEVIDDPLNGTAINGSSNLGQISFYDQFAEGKQSLFDNIGIGPDSDDFMGEGFNFLRFNINGFQLSPGDSAVITAMGCYSNDENYCPERYEIPASVVPVPAAIWLMGSGLLGMIAWSRTRS